MLQRRYNTGLLDGLYDVSCSGHLEHEESVTTALIRETEEELGIIINKANLEYSSTIHSKFFDSEYIFVTFFARDYHGIPKINEPDKCDDLKWYELNNLPSNLSDTRKIMIKNYLNHVAYSEYGF